MKIAIVRPYASILSNKNYNVQEFGLAKSLLEKGISVDVYCAGKEKCIEIIECQRKSNNYFRIIRMPYITVLSFHSIFKGLFKMLKKEKYDLIQTQGYEQITSFLVVHFCKANRIPVVLHQGVYKTTYGRLLKPLMYVFHSTLGKYIRSNVLCCIAKTSMAKTFLKLKGFKKIRTLPIGLDRNKFNGTSFQNWREKIGVSNDRFLMLYVGVVEKRRNIDLLIKIVQELLIRGKECCLLIAGSGVDIDLCIRIVEKNNLTKNIFFVGELCQSELPNLYKAADVFVFPSDYEIVGMVLLESLYFKLPIISSVTAGSLDIVNKECGQLIHELNVYKWVEFLFDYIDNPEKYGFNNYLNKISFQRSWNDLSRQYKDFYCDVIRQNKAIIKTR